MRILVLVVAGLALTGCGRARSDAACEPVIESDISWPYARVTLVHQETSGDGVAAIWDFDATAQGESRIRVRPIDDTPLVPDPEGGGGLVPIAGARHLELVFEGVGEVTSDDLYSPEVLIQGLHFIVTPEREPRWVVGVAKESCLELALDRTVPALVLRAYPRP